MADCENLAHGLMRVGNEITVSHQVKAVCSIKHLPNMMRIPRSLIIQTDEGLLGDASFCKLCAMAVQGRI